MVTTTISYDALKHRLGHDLSLDEIGEALFDMGMELEGNEGDEISIEITPERLDLLSVEGLARALKSYLGLTPNVPKYFTHESDYVVNVTEHVKQVRPYTVCAVVKNLRLDDEKIKQIIEVQEKLHDTLARKRQRGAIGIYPMEVITWPIKYTAAEPHNIKFTPLGEVNPMNGLEILQRHDTGRAYAHLLEGMAVYPYFIDGANSILSMPPIINSEQTGRVSVATTELFIECSGFELQHLNQLLINLVTMFADMGGDIYSVTQKYEDGKEIITPNLNTTRHILHVPNIKKLLGREFSVEEIKKLLKSMMYVVEEEDDEDWTVLSPAFRFDVWHEVDIIDDIARAYGYNNFELGHPKVVSIGGTLPLTDLREELSEIMVGLGFLESYSFALGGKQEQLSNMLIDEEKINFVSIANGTEQQQMLRVSLLPGQFSALAHNRNKPLPQRLFEGAYVVIPDENKDVKSRNELHMAAVMADKVVTYTQIKQVLDALLRSRGIEVTVKETSHPSFLKGRVAMVLYKDVPIGIVGEINPKLLENFGLITPVAAFEINLEKLITDDL